MAIEGARAYRPQFHYTPEKGWINDPNGLMFDGEKYHVFAQHYPFASTPGPMHWAHATSRDLLHFDRLPIALYPGTGGMCFSGSACLMDGKIALMYTAHGDAEAQFVAFSDDGVTFIPHPNNPVIKNPGCKDYRDPKLFWNGARAMYGVAVAAGDHVEFFASNDLITWQKTGEFSDQTRVTGIHECPDVFPLRAPNGETVYVMIASMILPIGGNRTQYVFGTFDGDAFRLTRPFPAPEWIDAGHDDYAPVTFYGSPAPMMMGWASNWKYGHRLPTGDYAGALTFPRGLSLAETKGGLRLAQIPLVDSITGAYVKTSVLPGESFRLKIRAQGNFRTALVSPKGERLVIACEDNVYAIDRTSSGECGRADEILGPDFGVARRARYMDGAIEMDVLFDVCMLEVFADQGTYAATMLAFPTAPYARVEAENCQIEVSPLEG